MRKKKEESLHSSDCIPLIMEVLLIYRGWFGKNLLFFRNKISLSLSKTNSSLSGIILPLSMIISPRSKGFRSYKICLSKWFLLFLFKNFLIHVFSPSSALLQTSLSKEPSETLDASTTFDFLVSVFNSNLFRITGSLECLCCWRRPTCFYKVFEFLVYVL